MSKKPLKRGSEEWKKQQAEATAKRQEQRKWQGQAATAEGQARQGKGKS